MTLSQFSVQLGSCSRPFSLIEFPLGLSAVAAQFYVQDLESGGSSRSTSKVGSPSHIIGARWTAPQK